VSKSAVKKIKNLEMQLLLGADLNAQHVEELYEFLKTFPDSDDVVIAALLILTESNEDVVLDFLNRFNSLGSNVQRLSIPCLVSTDYVEVYVWLIELLEVAEDDELIEIVIFSLSVTHYPVIPLLLEKSLTDNGKYYENLKKVIKLMSLESVVSFIGAFPSIPHESMFREIFGSEKIDEIKQKI
jgi:hypothetical protein